MRGTFAIFDLLQQRNAAERGAETRGRVFHREKYYVGNGIPSHDGGKINLLCKNCQQLDDGNAKKLAALSPGSKCTFSDITWHRFLEMQKFWNCVLSFAAASSVWQLKVSKGSFGSDCKQQPVRTCRRLQLPLWKKAHFLLHTHLSHRRRAGQ